MKEQNSDEYGEDDEYDRNRSDRSVKTSFIKLTSLSNVTSRLRTVSDSMIL